MSRDFSFNNRDFKMRKLDAMKQFHIARRIGPILAELLPALKGAGFEKFSTPEALAKLSDDQKFEIIGRFVIPIMGGLSKLSDADADLVLYGLCSCVEIKQSTGNWANVSSASMLMIQDLDLPTLVNIAGRSFVFNLAGFFTVLQQ